MLKPLAPAIRLGSLLASAFWLLAASARADLVWTPQTGWRIEGGVVSGLTGAQGRNALELMNKARSAEEDKSLLSAARSYEKVAHRYSNSFYAPEALYRAARVRLARKQYSNAFNDFQEVITRYPNTKRFNEIIGEQYRLAGAVLDGARERSFWGLLPGFPARERAIGYFENVLANAPHSDYAPLALMNIARGHQRLGNTPEAIDALDRMINTYQQSLLTPDAYLKLAQAHASLVEGPYYTQISTRDAVTYFEDFMILFPNEPKVGLAEKGVSDMKSVLAESKMKMADFYFYKRANYVAARILYNEAITVYPESEVARRAKLRLADVETKAAGKPLSNAAPATQPKKKRYWLF
ncbi:MAG: tetratricopeptide repeat protein [Opitutaceae bacterium]|nr:tetratricopeptide repeat protein [Opitutaceae bacterium]